MPSTKAYYLSVARIAANTTIKDMEYSIEMLGATRDSQHLSTWILNSVEPLGVIFSMLQVRLGDRYIYSLTNKPGKDDTVFAFRFSAAGIVERAGICSGEFPAGHWELLQSLLEALMITKEAAVPAVSARRGEAHDSQGGGLTWGSFLQLAPVTRPLDAHGRTLPTLISSCPTCGHSVAVSEGQPRDLEAYKKCAVQMAAHCRAYHKWIIGAPPNNPRDPHSAA